MVQLRRVERPGRFPVWREVYPAACPGCRQPYRGGHVAIGWLACHCAPDVAEHRGHRTLFCRDCGFELFMPPHHADHDRPAQAPARTSDDIRH